MVKTPRVMATPSMKSARTIHSMGSFRNRQTTAGTGRLAGEPAAAAEDGVEPAGQEVDEAEVEQDGPPGETSEQQLPEQRHDDEARVGGQLVDGDGLAPVRPGDQGGDGGDGRRQVQAGAQAHGEEPEPYARQRGGLRHHQCRQPQEREGQHDGAVVHQTGGYVTGPGHGGQVPGGDEQEEHAGLGVGDAQVLLHGGQQGRQDHASGEVEQEDRRHQQDGGGLLPEGVFDGRVGEAYCSPPSLSMDS